MTEEELSNLIVDKLTFITTDKKGKETTWRTTPDVDHSYLCDGWDIENFNMSDEKEETLKPIGIFSTEQGENSNEICFGFKRYK